MSNFRVYGPEYIDVIFLENTRDNHNKYYDILVISESDTILRRMGWRVKVHYGPMETKGRWRANNNLHFTREQVLAEVEIIKNEKFRKGYAQVPRPSSVSFSPIVTNEEPKVKPSLQRFSQLFD